MTVEGGTLRKPAQIAAGDEFRARIERLPEATLPVLYGAWDLLVGGVGGTGVVTVGAEHVVVIDATMLAERLLGHSVYSNVLMLGFAWQRGMVPVSRRAIERAIELNGVSVDWNLQAFNWGRLAACEPGHVNRATGLLEPETAVPTLDAIIRRRMDFLCDYQDAAWANSYLEAVERVRRAEAALDRNEELSEAVAHNLFRLMSYKDEYEVARLFTSGGFLDKLKQTFEGDYKLKLHLAPPLLRAGKDALGRPKKREFGSWMLHAMHVLALGKRVRGTALDPFGYLAERRAERRLIAQYRALLDTVLPGLNASGYPLALKLARLPEQVRGFGPVKEKAIVEMEEARARLLQEYSGDDRYAEVA